MPVEVTADGQVIPPRNITKPVPILDIRDFQWRGFGRSAQPQPQPEEEGHEEHSAGQVPMVASSNFKLSTQRVASAPVLIKPGSAEETLHKQLTLDKERKPLLPFPLHELHGSYSGNGFNMIFIPTNTESLKALKKKLGMAENAQFKLDPDGPADNILQVNLTTEQWTFGPTLGEVPNRGLGNDKDIILGALPYLQTVQDVTNFSTGKPDNPQTDKGIHLEPGVFLWVPPSTSTKNQPSIVRMASIPHGTTINAQGLAPNPSATVKARPKFEDFQLDTTPFHIGDPSATGRMKDTTFRSMNADKSNPLREPIDLSKFNNKGGSGRITTEIIKNPIKVLEKALEGLDVVEFVTFELSTGPSNDKSTAKVNGGGTSNISFLHGPQSTITTAVPLPANGGNPNAHAEFFTNRWWVQKVMYEVNLPQALSANETLKEISPNMPMVPVDGQSNVKQPSLAPTPVFTIVAPKTGLKKGILKVPGIQLQYSQTVNLNFATLTWPHVSVATLVPTAPQVVVFPEETKRK